MLKTSEAVASIIGESLEASLMLQRGCLNLSAYAKLIQPDVEAATKKPVQLGSIVIALSRLSKTFQTEPTLLPKPSALEISARSGLMEVVFERTQKNLELFQVLQQKAGPSTSDFFVGTQGIGEITLMINEQRFPLVESVFKGVEPKFVLRNLSGLTVRTTAEDIFIPNVFFSILYPFAMHRLNVIEIVSTYTEITMFLEDKDVAGAFEILKQFLKRPV